MYIFKEISHRRVNFFQKEAQMRKLSHDVTLSQLLYPPPHPSFCQPPPLFIFVKEVWRSYTWPVAPRQSQTCHCEHTERR